MPYLMLWCSTEQARAGQDPQPPVVCEALAEGLQNVFQYSSGVLSLWDKNILCNKNAKYLAGVLFPPLSSITTQGMW